MWLLPLPHLLQLSDPYRLNEHQRCPVAEETRVGEWGVSAAGPVEVPPLPSGRAAPSPWLGRGRATPPFCFSGEN